MKKFELIITEEEYEKFMEISEERDVSGNALVVYMIRNLINIREKEGNREMLKYLYGIY